ncbi:senescence-associated carboxylesterase 101-like isoform X1 [Ziziphus jujuba]|uniref:Senescence-associated carboxylesterase 101-like isoform X1 n=1 Tax=Ziziphus jujuba TaxID=326968 RepID=A0A6P4A026_ZIZJJ|nr:senescence-associated carboxylesterase 101-like isoform X1 [Ziziphus jujuba]
MNLFNNGSEMANLVVSSGLLQQSWTVNSNLYGNSDPNERLTFKVYPQQNYNILGFVSSPRTLEGDEAELVSSSTFPLFEFLCSKNNPSFSINKAAISLFDSYHFLLSELKTQLCQGPPYKSLIITGHSLGGSIASLFTLWMLDSMVLSKTKRPLCITFGSPLIGDSSLQKAIFQSQTWNSCFLHVVSNQDPIPRIFLHHNPVHQTGVYKPFGTFLICSELGCACFAHPNSVLELLPASASYGAHGQHPHQILPFVDYGPMVENLYHRTFCRDAIELDEWATQPFEACISRQLQAIGVGRPQQQNQKNEEKDINLSRKTSTDLQSAAFDHSATLPSPGSGSPKWVQNLIKRTKNWELKLQIAKQFDPSKKLNDIKVNMVYLEWYKKWAKDQKTGYYDMYKNNMYESDVMVQKYKEELTNYWINMVNEVKIKPQKEGADFQSHWLYAGTTYRRMIEPLDIAEHYYEKKRLNYETEGRSDHYILLEEWLKEAKEIERYATNLKKENVASILTIDSCFWAKVEEAIISCNLLKTEKYVVEEKVKKLKDFENYVLGLLTNYEVSPQIFLPESSSMKWWKDWKAYRKTLGIT